MLTNICSSTPQVRETGWHLKALCLFGQRLISVVTQAHPCWYCSSVWSWSRKEDVLHVPWQPGPCGSLSHHSPSVTSREPSIARFMCLCTPVLYSQPWKWVLSNALCVSRVNSAFGQKCVGLSVVRRLGWWICCTCPVALIQWYSTCDSQ